MTVTNAKETMYAGEKRIFAYAIIDRDTVGDPPLNLTGLTVRWAISRLGANGYSKQPVVKKDSAGVGGVVITSAVGGLAEVTIMRADTETLLGDFHIECEVADGSGEYEVVAVADLEILVNVDNSLSV